MAKGRKTGNNASKLSKLIRTTLIKNAPSTSENPRHKKKKPTVKEEPGDPDNTQVMEESFGSQARRLMSIVR